MTFTRVESNLFRHAVRPTLQALILAAVLGAPLAAQDRPAATRTRPDRAARAAEVIEKFKQKDPGLGRFFADAAGYVVFPTVAKGAVGVGGARGKGYVYEQGRLVGRATLTQVSIGLQAGGQAYSEVVFLKSPAALENFKQGHLKLDAQASAVALSERLSRDLGYRGDVAIVTMAQGGLMVEASVGGQKFSFHAAGRRS